MHTQKEPNPIFRFNNHIPNTNQMTGTICGISEGESKYIYHHLRSGCILNIETEWSSGERSLYALYYGSHRLGRLSTEMSNRVSFLLENDQAFRLTIGAIFREKYLPPAAIEVDLEWGKEDQVQAA